ncbi:MAG: Asp23/Gls24 family envelope stress response protein [Tissierellia bacterium]|nr:Asp23/Gls24 family envelope stress response protein [Tissierellia bacterium]
MSIIKNYKHGIHVISEEVIEEIAYKAASECYGVVDLSPKSAGSVRSLLKMDPSNRGVKIEIVDNCVNVTLFLILRYGVKVSVVARNVMDNVKYKIEDLLDIPVESVNVSIEGVSTGE